MSLRIITFWNTYDLELHIRELKMFLDHINIDIALIFKIYFIKKTI